MRCHQTRTPKSPQRPVDVKLLSETMLANSLLSYSLQDLHGEFSCPHYWKLPPAYLERQCQQREWRPDLPGGRLTTAKIMPPTVSLDASTSHCALKG
jgi:hypothetical protein